MKPTAAEKPRAALVEAADRLQATLSKFDAEAAAVDRDERERDKVAAAYERERKAIDPHDDRAVHRLAAMKTKLELLSDRVAQTDARLGPLRADVKAELVAVPDVLREHLAPLRNAKLAEIADGFALHFPNRADAMRVSTESVVVRALDRRLACYWHPHSTASDPAGTGRLVLAEIATMLEGKC